jgi:hypothetical protein
MGELKYSDYKKTSGFNLEASQIDIQIYRLISVIAGSKIFSEKIANSDEAQKWKWFKKNEIPELSRLLLSIAAISRSNIDSWNSHSETDKLNIERPVGVLFQDINNMDNHKPLKFRNACNKILHTDKFNPEANDQSRGLDSELKPMIHLYGSHYDNDWKIRLNVYDFALCAGSFV